MTVVSSSDPYKKICRHAACKKSFIADRSNKEYCSAACKVKANNGKARDLRVLMSKINFQLKRNREILEYFFEAGKTEVNLDALQVNGFDHTKLTELIKGEGGAYDVPSYYNYSLQRLTNKNFKINKLW